MPYLSKLNLNGTTYDLKAEASGAVSGVKGEAEDEYRDGNVNITRENLGLGTVATSNMITIGTDNAERSVRADYLHNAIQSMIDTSVGNAINASY